MNTLKVIIAGSRDITDYAIVELAIANSGIEDEITTIVSGTARGVDQLGERYAKEHKKKLAKFPADWDTYGKKAGYLRNTQMAEYSDALIGIWDGASYGTKHMIDIANRAGLYVYVYRLDLNK
jgi:hypothetical protein